MLILDEATHFSSRMVKFIRSRLRLATEIDYSRFEGTALDFIKPGFFPRALYCSNPGNTGHSFFKSQFIDPAPALEIWKADMSDGGMKRLFVPAFLSDNTELLNRDPNYADKLRGIGGPQAEQMLTGDWSIASGSVLEDVWSPRHQFLPDIEWSGKENVRITRNLDWGSFHPFAIVYMAEILGESLKTETGDEIILPTGSQVVIHEYYGWNGSENEGCRWTAFQVGELLAQIETDAPWGHLVRKGPADTQIFQKRGGTSETIDDHLRRGYNDYLDRLHEEGRDGVDTRHKSSLFIPADQGTGSRRRGLNVLRDYLYASKEEEDQKGLYFIQSKCKHIIRTLPTLPRSETDPEDAETHGVEDHLFDTIKYALMNARSTFKRIKITGI